MIYYTVQKYHFDLLIPLATIQSDYLAIWTDKNVTKIKKYIIITSSCNNWWLTFKRSIPIPFSNRKIGIKIEGHIQSQRTPFVSLYRASTPHFSSMVWEADTSDVLSHHTFIGIRVACRHCSVLFMKLLQDGVIFG